MRDLLPESEERKAQIGKHEGRDRSGSSRCDWHLGCGRSCLGSSGNMLLVSRALALIAPGIMICQFLGYEDYSSYNHR